VVTCFLEHSVEISQNVSYLAVAPQESIISKIYCMFEYFPSSMCDKRHLHRCVIERQLCISRRRSTQSDAYRRSVHSTLHPCSSDGPDIRQQSRFLTHHLHWTPPLILVVYGSLDRGINSRTDMLPSLEQELSYRKQIARQLRTQYAVGIYRHKYYTVTLKSRLSVT